MFEHPPEWLRPLWLALSNLTSWFDWTALGAIGTVGALWFAIVEATASSRAQRKRDAALVKAILLIFANGRKMVHTQLTLRHAQEWPPAIYAPALVTSGGFLEVKRSLAAISVTEMPSTAALDLLMAARASWEGLEAALGELGERHTDAARSDVLSQINDMAEICASLGIEIRRLGGGPERHDNSEVKNWIPSVR